MTEYNPEEALARALRNVEIRSSGMLGAIAIAQGEPSDNAMEAAMAAGLGAMDKKQRLEILEMMANHVKDHKLNVILDTIANLDPMTKKSSYELKQVKSKFIEEAFYSLSEDEKYALISKILIKPNRIQNFHLSFNSSSENFDNAIKDLLDKCTGSSLDLTVYDRDPNKISDSKFAQSNLAHNNGANKDNLDKPKNNGLK